MNYPCADFYPPPNSLRQLTRQHFDVGIVEQCWEFLDRPKYSNPAGVFEVKYSQKKKGVLVGIADLITGR
jgi:hypothetical protein